jgi:hypothetical protein
MSSFNRTNVKQNNSLKPFYKIDYYKIDYYKIDYYKMNTDIPDNIEDGIKHV